MAKTKEFKNSGQVEDFNKEYYTIDKQVETRTGEIVTVKDYKKEFRTKGSVARGKLRTAEYFNVSISHLEEVATAMNNKKIDGLFFNDLIGRFGFYNGQVMSRADLASNLGERLSVLEVATEKLGKIIKSKDYIKAYKDYLNIMKKERELAEDEELCGGIL